MYRDPPPGGRAPPRVRGRMMRVRVRLRVRVRRVCDAWAHNARARTREGAPAIPCLVP